MPREIPVSGALAFATTAAASREQSYREHAAQLRRIAETAPLPQIRDKLLGLANQFERLAETVETLKRRRIFAP
jgi:hypothetical protein